VAGSSANGNTILFAGREYSFNTGLYYSRARYYDPSLERFINTDPIGYKGGINLYEYCSDGPITRDDPSGLTCLSDYEAAKAKADRTRIGDKQRCLSQHKTDLANLQETYDGATKKCDADSSSRRKIAFTAYGIAMTACAAIAVFSWWTGAGALASVVCVATATSALGIALAGDAIYRNNCLANALTDHDTQYKVLSNNLSGCEERADAAYKTTMDIAEETFRTCKDPAPPTSTNSQHTTSTIIQHTCSCG
jgi:RHS repeat-associated protein